MQSKWIFFGTIVAGFLSSTSYATPDTWSGYRPVGTLTGGVAGVSANHSQQFLGTDQDKFIYQSADQSKTVGLVGAFLGVEHPLQLAKFFVQTGLEYTYFGAMSVSGLHSVGIEPTTATHYRYNYDLQTQQLLASAKLFTTTELPIASHRIIYPYVSLGLGAAFNRASQYSTSTHETGSLNLTPTFNNNTNTAFSYNLGLGVDTNITERVRVGIGYRYSNFGQVSLGDGQIVFNNYRFPANFTLNVTNPYANQFVAQISYLA